MHTEGMQGPVESNTSSSCSVAAQHSEEEDKGSAERSTEGEDGAGEEVLPLHLKTVKVHRGPTRTFIYSVLH